MSNNLSRGLAPSEMPQLPESSSAASQSNHGETLQPGIPRHGVLKSTPLSSQLAQNDLAQGQPHHSLLPNSKLNNVQLAVSEPLSTNLAQPGPAAENGLPGHEKPVYAPQPYDLAEHTAPAPGLGVPGYGSLETAGHEYAPLPCSAGSSQAPPSESELPQLATEVPQSNASTSMLVHETQEPMAHLPQLNRESAMHQLGDLQFPIPGWNQPWVPPTGSMVVEPPSSPQSGFFGLQTWNESHDPPQFQANQLGHLLSGMGQFASDLTNGQASQYDLQHQFDHDIELISSNLPIANDLPAAHQLGDASYLAGGRPPNHNGILGTIAPRNGSAASSHGSVLSAGSFLVEDDVSSVSTFPSLIDENAEMVVEEDIVPLEELLQHILRNLRPTAQYDPNEPLSHHAGPRRLPRDPLNYGWAPGAPRFSIGAPHRPLEVLHPVRAPIVRSAITVSELNTSATPSSQESFSSGSESDISQDVPPPAWNPITPVDSSSDDDVASLDGALVPGSQVGNVNGELPNGAESYGYSRAKLIFRTRIIADFARRMATQSEEIRRMAQNLFDRYGRLKTELIDHHVRRGTGVWGDELSYGDILLIEGIATRADPRYRGIGRVIFEALVRQASQISQNFIILTTVKKREPSSLEEAVEVAPLERRSIEFIRSIGFRRVGNTDWFSYALESGHASRQLSVLLDSNPSPARPLFGDAAQIAFHMIPWSDESSCIQTFEAIYTDPEATIASWGSLNHSGSTVMHVAALNLQPRLLQWLWDRERFLSLRRDNSGYTPFEALSAQLELRRTFYPDPSARGANPDGFEGFTHDEVACLQILDIFHRSKDQIRFGCTCAKCFGGFISPRMMRRLQFHATDLFLRYNDEAQAIPLSEHPPEGSFFSESNDQTSGILPSRTRVMLTQSQDLRFGFANLFFILSQCLSNGIIPTDTNIASVTNTNILFGLRVARFLEAGGTYQAIRHLTWAAAASGNRWTGNGASEALLVGRFPDLPECRNDLEFALAERMCSF